MTQEDKQLLLKDLCARSLYGVKFALSGDNIYTMKGIDLIVTDEGYWEYAVKAKDIAPIEIEYIKPYLRPMSSMTEEEFKELTLTTELQYNQLELVDWRNGCKTLEFYLSEVPHYCVIKVFDWLNAHHFDYRGLIHKGLALEAPEGMYKIE
jgi:hypothetical protein